MKKAENGRSQTDLKKPTRNGIDAPERFDALAPMKKAVLLAWIAYAVRSSTRFDKTTSYDMKHCFEEVGFYVTNGEFKGAMLAAGYEPKDPEEKNWQFKVKPRAAKPDKGADSTYAEATGYVLRPDEQVVLAALQQGLREAACEVDPVEWTHKDWGA